MHFSGFDTNAFGLIDKSVCGSACILAAGTAKMRANHLLALRISNAINLLSA